MLRSRKRRLLKASVCDTLNFLRPLLFYFEPSELTATRFQACATFQITLKRSQSIFYDLFNFALHLCGCFSSYLQVSHLLIQTVSFSLFNSLLFNETAVSLLFIKVLQTSVRSLSCFIGTFRRRQMRIWTFPGALNSSLRHLAERRRRCATETCFSQRLKGLWGLSVLTGW